MKIAYCGYDFFHACLGDLIDSGHVLSELFTFPADNQYDFNDKVFALAQGVRARITLSPISPEDLVRLQSDGVEALICAAYPYKVPQWQPHLRFALNVHPSLLPQGRGRWPLPWVILKDLKETGVSIHEVSNVWDGGDLIAQQSIAVRNNETLESLSIRSQMAARLLLSKVMQDLPGAWKDRRPQPQGTAWPMPKRTDRTIRFDMPVGEIERIVRAFSKFEPFLFLEGIRYFVRRVDVWQEDHCLVPGTLVIESSRERLYAAVDGFVLLSSYERADENKA
jgi:methionyl-tRNA formyltransferase